MSSIPFVKMSGAGNDFVLLTRATVARTGKSLAALARTLCDRRRGVGADGLLVVARGKEGAVSLAYNNADGSAAFCGNGSRCAAWYAHHSGIVRGRRFALRAGHDVLRAEVTGRERVRLSMPAVRDVRMGLRLPVGGRMMTVHHLNTGVPHAVVFVKDAGLIPVETLGPLLRRHKAFLPAGANANFVSEGKGGMLVLRTFERGVEAETLACGTGAAAASVAAVLLGRRRPPVRCLTRGGDVLTAAFTAEAGGASGLTLEGPARIVFEGTAHV